jgi:hypothetical protein
VLLFFSVLSYSRLDTLLGFKLTKFRPFVLLVKAVKVSVKHWCNGTDRGEWSIGGMALTGESGALVEWH